MLRQQDVKILNYLWSEIFKHWQVLKFNLVQDSVQKQTQAKSTDRTFEWVERQQVTNLVEQQPMSNWGGVAASATWMQTTNISSTSNSASASASGSASAYAPTSASGTWMQTTNSSSTSLSPKNSCDKSSNSSFSLFTGFWRRIIVNPAKAIRVDSWIHFNHIKSLHHSFSPCCIKRKIFCWIPLQIFLLEYWIIHIEILEYY